MLRARSRRSAAGRSSTIRPAYMTSTRSQTSRDDRDVVADEQERPRRSSRRIAASRPSTCCCTVTSSAVVGSSAMISRGVPISPMPIIARWRMPPENSKRVLAGAPLGRRGTRTARRRSTARAERRATAQALVVAADLGELGADPHAWG